MRDLMDRVGGLPWSKTGATHYHARLGLPDKGFTIRGLVVGVWPYTAFKQYLVQRSLGESRPLAKVMSYI